MPVDIDYEKLAGSVTGLGEDLGGLAGEAVAGFVGTGASIGATIGLVGGPVGAAIGAGAGTVVGGIGAAITHILGKGPRDVVKLDKVLVSHILAEVDNGTSALPGTMTYAVRSAIGRGAQVKLKRSGRKVLLAWMEARR